MTLETIYYITQIIAVGLILISLVAIYVQQGKDCASPDDDDAVGYLIAIA